MRKKDKQIVIILFNAQSACSLLEGVSSELIYYFSPLICYRCGFLCPSFIKVKIMLQKKNSIFSSNTATSEPQSPLSPRGAHRSPKLFTPSSNTVGSTSRNSKSKNKKKSAGKLFQKAHQTEQGETYLKNLKGTKSSSPSQNRRLDQQGRKIFKSNSLGVHNELNIKVEGKEQDYVNDLSYLINNFDNEVWEEDLSSIKESGSQLLSETGANQSLIRAMNSI